MHIPVRVWHGTIQGASNIIGLNYDAHYKQNKRSTYWYWLVIKTVPKCSTEKKRETTNKKSDKNVVPSKGVVQRYPALQEVTMSRIGTPASASASVAALIHADLVPV